MRLCFSRCSPSVTRYISLRTCREGWTVLLVLVGSRKATRRPLRASHLFLLLQPGRLVLQHAQLVLGQRQLLAGRLQRTGQLLVGHLELDVLHVALLLLAVQLVALELQLQATVVGVSAEVWPNASPPPPSQEGLCTFFCFWKRFSSSFSLDDSWNCRSWLRSCSRSESCAQRRREGL